MLLTDFDYHLPESSIAQTPAEPRDSAKLLCMDKRDWSLQDKIFSDIADMLTDNDVLVVNETRVINARLKWRILSETLPFNWREVPEGGWDDLKECEIFLHKQVSDNTWNCLVYPGKKLKPGVQVIFENTDMQATIIKNSDKWRLVEFTHTDQDFLDIIEQIWETPLPPYIKDSDAPSERYQTVYNDSQKSGSVAAPTAGLHFTPELMNKLESKWVKIEKVCLHVWLGTFMNVEVENIEDHHMHSEQIYISPETSHRLNEYKSTGKRIIAVGTTSVRTLESFSDNTGHLWHGTKDTNIFIYPGYEWRFIESLITNFHLPKSTLLMLVSSLAGSENIKKAYEYAVDSDYRFFSFWDAMWIS